jgi:hypothetical protein
MTTSTQADQLDGKSFEGLFVQKGKTEGDRDTLIFKGGRFRSTACERYGYGDAPYQAVAEGDAIRFAADTNSAQYGKLEWRGVVRGDRLESTVMSIRSGQAPIENEVKATLKK